MKKSVRPSKIVNVANILPEGWLKGFDPAHAVVGLGMDVGTTTKAKSNPSVLTVCQRVGHERRWPLIVRWKSKDPDVAEAIIRAVVAGLRSIGLRPRRLCIDATSEKYFAVTLRKKLRALLTVELIVSSENTIYGNEKMLWKAYLGNLLVNCAEDGNAALPAGEWVKKDIRSVVTNKGTFDAEVLEDGGHGDVFDGCKLALHAVESQSGPAEAGAAATGTLGGGLKTVRAGVKNPYASQFTRQSGNRRAI